MVEHQNEIKMRQRIYKSTNYFRFPVERLKKLLQHFMSVIYILQVYKHGYLNGKKNSTDRNKENLQNVRRVHHS